MYFLYEFPISVEVLVEIHLELTSGIVLQSEYCDDATSCLLSVSNMISAFDLISCKIKKIISVFSLRKTARRPLNMLIFNFKIFTSPLNFQISPFFAIFTFSLFKKVTKKPSDKGTSTNHVDHFSGIFDPLPPPCG